MVAVVNGVWRACWAGVVAFAAGEVRVSEGAGGERWTGPSDLPIQLEDLKHATKKGCMVLAGEESGGAAKT